MKKIYFILISILSFDAYGNTEYGRAINIDNLPGYLRYTANAWNSILGAFGPTAAITTRLKDKFDNNQTEFQELISILGYNESPITIFETVQHINSAFSYIDAPLSARRSVCPSHIRNCDPGSALIFFANGFGGWRDYTSENNGDFNTNYIGVTVGAQTYLTDGVMLGLGYTYNKSDTDDDRIYGMANTNSLTAYIEYLSKSGFYINAGINAGQTNWVIDKEVIDVFDDTQYDTNFYAAQITTGIKIQNKSVYIIPQVGARFIHFTSEQHTDSAVQSFDEWSRNSVTAMAKLNIGSRFEYSSFAILPMFLIGAGYDVMRDGDDEIRARLVNGSTYFIPIEEPKPLALNAGISLGFSAKSININLQYKLDSRRNFMGHDFGVNVKIEF